MCNPHDPVDRETLVAAIADADELATALPSVRFYGSGGPAAVTNVLTEGLGRRAPGRPGVLYAAENDNRAAEILAQELSQAGAGPALSVQLLNTVIGKMSGVIADAPTIERLGLAPLTPTTPRAILVESFNRILISRIDPRLGYHRAIPVFEEKADLLPFEEAKLYGHNAIHAWLGYLAQERGLVTMAEATGQPDLMTAARTAFLTECGAALIKKHGAIGDALFTPAGFQTYADDLLVRMVNPNLDDRVARIIRDPVRKLAWNDRLCGAMRIALEQGIVPHTLARGAAAAVRYWRRTAGKSAATRGDVEETLRGVWGPQDERTAQALIDLIWAAWEPR